jgi:hypothetical protein
MAFSLAVAVAGRFLTVEVAMALTVSFESGAGRRENEICNY